MLNYFSIKRFTLWTFKIINEEKMPGILRFFYKICTLQVYKHEWKVMERSHDIVWRG